MGTAGSLHALSADWWIVVCTLAADLFIFLFLSNVMMINLMHKCCLTCSWVGRTNKNHAAHSQSAGNSHSNPGKYQCRSSYWKVT